MTAEAVERAKATLEALGYVVLREKSYRQAQERQRVADALREHAEDDVASTRRWAESCLDEERCLRDRLTFVYGVARAHGATVEDLRQPEGEKVP
jgi:queuine/archaeosine tRNA-ribosyltransferase